MYLRFIEPNAAPRKAVWVSRISIILMAVLAGVFATFIQNIASVWQFLVTLGAGLGSVSAVRWYWSRVTPKLKLQPLASPPLRPFFSRFVAAKPFLAATMLGFLFEIQDGCKSC